jgi:hypothetical protein
MRKVSVGKPIPSGSSTLFYTVPDGYRASWTLLYAVNHTSSAKNLTVTWYDKSANISIDVFFNYPLAAKNYLMFDGGAWVMLEEGDTITIAGESGMDGDAIVSFEVERNNG